MLKLLPFPMLKYFDQQYIFLKIIFHLLTNEIMYHFLFGSASTRVLIIIYASRTSFEIEPIMQPPIKIDFSMIVHHTTKVGNTKYKIQHPNKSDGKDT